MPVMRCHPGFDRETGRDRIGRDLRAGRHLFLCHAALAQSVQLVSKFGAYNVTPPVLRPG
jgi:hypothetical protein